MDMLEILFFIFASCELLMCVQAWGNPLTTQWQCLQCILAHKILNHRLGKLGTQLEKGWSFVL